MNLYQSPARVEKRRYPFNRAGDSFTLWRKGKLNIQFDVTKDELCLIMDGLNLIMACKSNSKEEIEEAVKLAFEGLQMVGGQEGWVNLVERLIAIGDEHM